MEPLDCGAGRDLLRAGLSDEGIAVVAAGIDAIWSERALRPEEIAPASPELAAEVFASLAEAGRAELDDEARLVGVHGFTLRTTRHCFVQDGVTHHTWCAFDSVGIPAAFGIDAVAATDCPACHALLEVKILAGEPIDADIVQWLPAPDATTHLMQQFCANADLYCSRAHLEATIDVTAASGRVLTLAEAAELGRETWADVTPRAG